MNNKKFLSNLNSIDNITEEIKEYNKNIKEKEDLILRKKESSYLLIPNLNDTGWIQTYTGKRFDILNPSLDSICIEDIARSLSKLCRFLGHLPFFYSVGQHSLIVSDLVWKRTKNKALAFWGLMHDASEAYLGDLVRPLKVLPQFAFYKDIEKIVMNKICEKYEIDNKEPEMVKQIDKLVLYLEHRDIRKELHPDNAYIPGDEWSLAMGINDIPKIVVEENINSICSQFIFKFNELRK